MTRKNPPFLSLSGLTGYVYIVNRYTHRSDGTVVASEKFNVTGEFRVIAAADPAVRAAVLAEVRDRLEESEQHAAAVFVGRMITKEQGDA